MFMRNWWQWNCQIFNWQNVQSWKKILSERESAKYFLLTVAEIYHLMTSCFFFPGMINWKDISKILDFSLCERSPREIKLHYAFSIYDFDGDNFIGVGDIEQVFIFWIKYLELKLYWFQATRLLTQGQLTNDEIEQIWRKVLEETDIDDDKKLSNNEFTHVINKCPDFLTTFNVRI